MVIQTLHPVVIKLHPWYKIQCNIEKSKGTVGKHVLDVALEKEKVEIKDSFGIPY